MHPSGEVPLKEAFQGLFQIALCKKTYVMDLMLWNNEDIVWDVTFSRPLHDGGWEVYRFSFIFYSLIVLILMWKISWFGFLRRVAVLLLNLYYKVLTSGSEESFPWKNIWKDGTPTRVAYFTWTAAKVKILSSLHWIIQRRGISVLLIGTAWVRTVRNRWINCSFTVTMRVAYDHLCYASLRFLG